MPGHLVISGGGSVAVGSITGLGTGVAAALAANVGSAGAPVVFNGALGTPSSGTLTNATGLPVSTGISGLGANVGTFLATPSSANLAAAVTDETGSGKAVFGTTPSLTLLKEAFTSSDTLTTAESGKICTNDGASGAVELTLPAATGSGVYYTALVAAAQTFGFKADGTDTIQQNATTSAGGGTINSATAGRVATIVDYASGKWMVKDVIGAWTVT